MYAAKANRAKRDEFAGEQPKKDDQKGQFNRPASDNVALPPVPMRKSPSYVQKRRSNVTKASLDKETPNEKKDAPSAENLGKRRTTRSKSVVDIMKIHSSTSSIPAAVENEDSMEKEVQRSGSHDSLAQSPNVRTKVEDTSGKFGMDQFSLTSFVSGSTLGAFSRQVSKFASDSAILQDINIRDSNSADHNDFLPADHPLMKRYQVAIRQHLTQQKEQLLSDMKQTDNLVKIKRRDYEKIGKDVYAMQQELEKLHRSIAQQDETFLGVTKERQLLDEQVATLSEQLKAAKMRTEEMEKTEKLTKDELRRLNNQINEKLSDVAITNHMTIAKNAVKKAQQDLMVVEQEKSRQETVTTRLTEAATKKENELKAVDAQIRTMLAEVEEKRQKLMMLNGEIQTISMEKRNLLQRWNATLKGMRRRDEEYFDVQAALRNHQQNATRVEGELSSLAKVYANVRESNDRYIGTLVRLQDEIERCTKLVNEAAADSNKVEADCALYQQALDDFVLQKNSLQKEKSSLQQVLNGVVAKLRFEQQEMAKLDDTSAEFSSAFQTLDNSTTETLKQLDRLRKTNRELEKACTNLETDLEKESTLWMETESSVQALRKSCDDCKELTEQTRVKIDRSQQDLDKDAQMLNRKLLQIEVLSKRINVEKPSIFENFSNKPQRFEAETVQKSIGSCDERIAKLQREWMKFQGQLIRISEVIEKENASIIAIMTGQTELEQMKIRLQGEIVAVEDEETQLRRRIDQLHLLTAKLNEAITQKLGAKASLESDHLSSCGHFAELLKNAELEVVQMDEKLTKKIKEKQDLDRLLREAERQLRFWEQKISEAKAAKDRMGPAQDDKQNRLIADVHRMQLRLGQLGKMQQTTIKEMEKAVFKRNVLLHKGEAVTAAKTVQLTQAQLSHAVIDLRRKVKQFQKDLETAEREEEEYRLSSETSNDAIESKAVIEKEATKKLELLTKEVSNLSAVQFKNANLLAAEQMRHKRLEDAREGRYEPLCKDSGVLEERRRKEVEKNELLLQLVSVIGSTYPNLVDSVSKIEAVLKI